MNKVSLRYVLIVFLAAVAFGCSDDEEAPKGKYEHGVFILNEGGQASNGSVSFYDQSTSEIKNGILGLNSTSFVGLYPQSITFSGDRSYVVVGGDNKIAVADANTFESISTIADPAIITPRYVQVVNNKAYISVWGERVSGSLVDSYVLVYDLSKNTVVKKISTDEGTESLLYNGTYLFASNYNYGGSNTVSVINPTDNTLVKQIEVSYGPDGMVIDADGKLWVICSDFVSGSLHRINASTLTVEATIKLSSAPGSDLAITPDKRNILYTVGTSVYKLAISSTSETANPLFTSKEASSIYSFNVDPNNGDIWIADPLAYSTPGKFFVYTSDGKFSTSGTVGIIPGQIIFK